MAQQMLGASVMRVLRNQLIQSIPAASRLSFVADLQSIDIDARSRLANAGSPMLTVYFPIGAVISAVFESKGASMEIHGVGLDGMLGADITFAPERIRFDLVCQIAGPMLSMPYGTFKAHTQRNAALARALALYSMSVLAFLTQSAACNALHPIAQRCARWLLVTSDRVGALDFALTHELLARMLGAHRPGVSVAVARLQRLRLIVYRLGSIRILDKTRLEVESCECYRAVVRETSRIFRQPEMPALTSKR